MSSELPYLKEEEVRRRAAEFLLKHNPKGLIPTPIEKIIEFEFELDIIPVPGLMDCRGINGYLSSDRTGIYVDDALLKGGRNRYFFTLAHDLAHYILHSAIYEELKTDRNWKEMREALSPSAYVTAEWQADTFAGLVLVPPEKLKTALAKAFEELSARVLARDKKFDLTGEAFWSYLAESIGKTFGVSPVTARIRLENDNLWRRLPKGK